MFWDVDLKGFVKVRSVAADNADELLRRAADEAAIARRYLDEHSRRYPKIFALPVAHEWRMTDEQIEFATEKTARCDAKARVQFDDSVGYGAPANPAWNEVACRRPAGHGGPHVSSCQKVRFRRRWWVTRWKQ